MVCNRCIKVLKDELEKNNIELLKIELGYLQLNITNDDEIETLKEIVESNGFLLITSAEEKLTETTINFDEDFINMPSPI